jgi:hypothetical protein
VVGLLPEARRAYAEALLEVCQRGAAPPAPALGAAGGRREMERRLLMIMREDVPARLPMRAALAVGVLALLALPAWTVGQAADPAAKDAKAQASAERDRQIQEMEKKLQALTKELQELKAAPAKPEKKLAEDKPRPAQGTFDPRQPNASWNTVFRDVLVNAPQPAEDQRLKAVEDKLRAVLKEVEALRGGPAGQPWVYSVLENPKTDTIWVDVNRDGLVDLYVANVTQAPPKPPAEMTLSRANYEMPAAKAEALGKFLREQVKAPVMEVKVEGDRLTVTTTPEVQRGIKPLVDLVLGKAPATPAKETTPRK